MKSVTLRIEGMRCEGFATNVRALLARTVGVQAARVTFGQREAQALYDPRQIGEEVIIAAVEVPGYRIAARRGADSVPIDVPAPVTAVALREPPRLGQWPGISCRSRPSCSCRKEVDR